MNFTTLRFKDCITDIIDNRGRNPDKYYDLEKYPVIDNYLIKRLNFIAKIGKIKPYKKIIISPSKILLVINHPLY